MDLAYPFAARDRAVGFASSLWPSALPLWPRRNSSVEAFWNCYYHKEGKQDENKRPDRARIAGVEGTSAQRSTTSTSNFAGASAIRD